MSSGTVPARPTAAAIVGRVPEAPAGVGPSRAAIAEVAALIAERFRPERIVLFGSRAYGVPTADSDVDLLVVIDTPRRPLDEALRIRQAIRLDQPFPLDILVRTPDQIRVGLAEGDFVIVDVMTKGAILLEAGDAGLGGQG